MVKPRHFPGLVAMASLALGARLAIVFIVLLMAAKAVHRGIAVAM
jgi:hypothetical protein